jgi:hypothetical protein
MRNDAELIKAIEPHDIVQIIPTDDNRGFDGLLAEVVRKETWGVIAVIRTMGVGSKLGVHRFPWSMIEPTGGRAVFGTDGKRVGDPGAAVKHHP